jgi:predicted aminopeptidase
MSREKLAAALLAALPLSGCSTISYYWQALDGQWEILRKRRPIAEVLADRHTPAPVRARLAALVPIREFASRELGLPDNRSYRSYADLGRPFVIWNVFATEEFSMRPTDWCFPIAGCVPYRGYFSKTQAEGFAAALPHDKYDVYLGGVPAYSTLGWFDDPVLNTFVHYPEVELARLVFHELAHQVVYVPGDAMFNESFATAVEEAGVSKWIAAEASARLNADWERSQTRRLGFQTLVLNYRKRLEDLYARPLEVSKKREEKARAFADLKRDYAILREGWGGDRGYDRWFGQKLNNAHLAAIAVYTQFVPAFRALLNRQGDDFRAFYRAVADLAKLPKEERDRRLNDAGKIPVPRQGNWTQ